jgi:hypothetical protein
MIAWLHTFRRLRKRWDYRADIHFRLFKLARFPICWALLGHLIVK